MHGLRRGWRLEGKNTASDFMICVSHFPLEWDEDNFKELIKDYGETEKCFLVRSKFLDNKSMGYGFLEFTSKSSAIIARNELHGKPVKYENRTYRIQGNDISLMFKFFQLSKSSLDRSHPRRVRRAPKLHRLLSTARRVANHAVLVGAVARVHVSL